MNNVKELSVKITTELKDAEVLLNQMKVRCQKLDGKQLETMTEWIRVFEGLYNHSLATEIKTMEVYGKYTDALLRLAEYKAKAKDAQERVNVLELITEKTEEEIKQFMTEHYNKLTK